jgi:hypothetical protein
MSRDITFENGSFTVSDDPSDIIGTLLIHAVGRCSREEIALRFAEDGEGFHVQETVTAHRAEERDDLPEPLEQDPAVDPAASELWVITAERYRARPRSRHVVLTGAELRELLVRAMALQPDLVGATRDL